MLPLEAGELGDFGLVVVEALDVSDFGEDATGEDRSKAWDGVEGVRDGLDLVFDGGVETLALTFHKAMQ